MITEDYVSFETAKLLKDKGFDEECTCLYDNDLPGTPGLEIDRDLCCINSSLDDAQYAAPTLQMAMKWLREVHNIHIIVFYYDNSAFQYIWYIFAHNGDKPHKANSYEEACEAAVKYCLENLI